MTKANSRGGLRTVLRCPRCGRAVPRLEKNKAGPFWTYRRHW